MSKPEVPEKDPRRYFGKNAPGRKPRVLLPFVQAVAPYKPVTPEYRLVECILLWAAVMEGRWPRKRGAIKATALHYFPAARIHDTKNHA
jgi:hypothetical protein